MGHSRTARIDAGQLSRKMRKMFFFEKGTKNFLLLEGALLAFVRNHDIERRPAGNMQGSRGHRHLGCVRNGAVRRTGQSRRWP